MSENYELDYENQLLRSLLVNVLARARNHEPEHTRLFISEGGELSVAYLKPGDTFVAGAEAVLADLLACQTSYGVDQLRLKQHKDRIGKLQANLLDPTHLLLEYSLGFLTLTNMDSGDDILSWDVANPGSHKAVLRVFNKHVTGNV